MAIITEEPDSPTPPLRRRKQKPESKPEPEISSPPSQSAAVSAPPKPAANATNPFHFWFYFTLVVSLVTIFCVLLSSLSPQDPKTWFLNLPSILRQHYSSGLTLKVQPAPNHPQVEVFAIHRGSSNSDSRVLIVHGLGCSSFVFRDVIKFLASKNVHAVAIDLPGSGFSDKSIAVVEEVEREGGLFDRMWQVYEDIKEKGLFWGFDQLVEQGYVDLGENKVRVVKKESMKAIELGSEEMGRVLGQVVDTMGLAPVDLVLHDSALGLGASWVSENPGLIRSVVVLDGSPSGTALPLWVLETPVVRDVVLGFRFMFERVIALCCVTSVGKSEAEAHRILLKGRDGRRAVAEMGKKLNSSFDLSEWRSLDSIKDLPIQVIWSGGWSDEWTAEGRRISGALSQASSITHSGGRWIQEHNAKEVAESIHKFVSSLPKSSRRISGEPLPEPHHDMFANVHGSEHHHHDHHHHHHGHGHGHGHAAGYIDPYGGLEHGWGMI